MRNIFFQAQWESHSVKRYHLMRANAHTHTPREIIPKQKAKVKGWERNTEKKKTHIQTHFLASL